MNKFLKIFLIAGCGAFIAAAGGVLYVRGRYRRALADVAALATTVGRPVRRPPGDPAQPNAADLYLQAGALHAILPPDQVKALDAGLRKPWSDPDGSLAKLVDSYQPALALLRRGAALARCDFVAPETTTITLRAPVPLLAGFIAVIRAALLGVRRAQSEGRLADASADASAVLAAAAQARAGGGGIALLPMVGQFIVERAFEPAADLIADPRLSASDAALLRDAAARAVGAGRALEDAVQAERELMENYNAAFLEKSLWFLPAARRRAFEEDYRRSEKTMTAALSRAVERIDPRSYLDAREAFLAKHVLRPQRPSTTTYLACLAAKDSYGDCFVANPLAASPDYFKLIMPIAVADAKAAVLAAAAGVRAAELAQGSPPTALSEVPGAPGDPFAGGASLRYAVDSGGWKVYSVGPDRKDDGGALPIPAADTYDWERPVQGDIVLAAARYKALRARVRLKKR